MPARPIHCFLPYRSFRFLPVFGAVILLAACGGDDTDWPQLLPSDQLLAEPEITRKSPEARDNTALEADLTAEAQALRARADQLRRKPVIDPETRRRLEAARGG